MSDIKGTLLKAYADFEIAYKPSGISFGTYDTPVNFNESLLTPIHRWYGYKEGFSPSFVRDFVTAYANNLNSVVFDPFGGVGTTALEACKLGYQSYLMDVNPLGLFASRIKTRHYTDEEISSIVDTAALFETIDDNPISISINNATVVNYFDNETWNSLLKVKSFISTIADDVVQDIFSLGLLSLIESISTHHKNGNGVKKKRIMPEPLNYKQLRDLLVNKIHLFVEDIKNVKLDAECKVLNQSNLVPYFLPQKVDIVLTSPPYANCFDYSKVYLTELWVGGFFNTKEDQKTFRESSVISHVHYRWQSRNESFGSIIVNELVAPLLATKNLWSNNIIPMLKGYFSCFRHWDTQKSHSPCPLTIWHSSLCSSSMPSATSLVTFDFGWV